MPAPSKLLLDPSSADIAAEEHLVQALCGVFLLQTTPGCFLKRADDTGSKVLAQLCCGMRETGTLIMTLDFALAHLVVMEWEERQKLALQQYLQHLLPQGLPGTNEVIAVADSF